MPDTPDTPDHTADLELKLRQTEELLAQAREALGAAERKRTIDRELASQGALDLETAALLTEAAVAANPQADIAAAVADLKRRKPFLFARPRRASAMAGAAPPDDSAPLDAAAAEARTTGDRRYLLRYLRLKRTA